MVIPRGVQQWPLVRTSRVFTASITYSGRAIYIFVNFSSDVREVDNWGLHWEMRNLVAVVNNTPLVGELDV